MFEIREYLDETGRSPFGRWFAKLNPQAALVITTAKGKNDDLISRRQQSDIATAQAYWREYKNQTRRN